TSFPVSATPATRSSAPRTAAPEDLARRWVFLETGEYRTNYAPLQEPAPKGLRSLTRVCVTGVHREVTSQGHTLAGIGDTRMKHPFRFWMTGCVAVVTALLGGGRALANERHPLTQSSRYRV